MKAKHKKRGRRQHDQTIFPSAHTIMLVMGEQKYNIKIK